MLGINTNAFIIISAAFGLLCGFLFFALRIGFPRSISGLSEWGWGCVLMVTAACGFTLPHSLPVILYSYLPNLMIAAGVLAMHRSLSKFGGLRQRSRWLYLLFGAAALALAWVTFASDDYRFRVILVSGLLAILFTACGTAIVRFTVKHFAEWFTCAIYAGAAAVMVVRWLAVVLQRGAFTVENDTSLVHDIYMLAFPFSLVAMSLGFLLMVNRALQGRLEAQAMHDPMSGAYRRDAFLEILGREIRTSAHRAAPLSLQMMDLDNFKAVNDTHGHLVGDKVIADFSARTQSLLRAQDVLGRYGGEEFVALLPASRIDAAVDIAERIRKAIAEASATDLPPYTVSIGVASLGDRYPDTLALLDAADKALYLAKRSGRDQVMPAAA